MLFCQSFDISFPSRADSPRQRETTAEDTGAGRGLWGDLGAVGIDGIPACETTEAPSPHSCGISAAHIEFAAIFFRVQEHADKLVRGTGAFAIIRDRIPRKAAGSEGVHGFRRLWFSR